MGTIVYCKCST